MHAPKANIPIYNPASRLHRGPKYAPFQQGGSAGGRPGQFGGANQATQRQRRQNQTRQFYPGEKYSPIMLNRSKTIATPTTHQQPSFTPVLDWKSPFLLNYISENGWIRPRRETKLNGDHQRWITRMIARAKNYGMLAWTHKTEMGQGGADWNGSFGGRSAAVDEPMSLRSGYNRGRRV